MANTSNALVGYLPIVVIVGAFYFLLLRPQQKRQRERNQLLQSVQVGDEVVTIGGLHGAVEQLDVSTVTLSVHDGLVLTFDRSAINRIVPRTEQSAEESAERGD